MVIVEESPEGMLTRPQMKALLEWHKPPVFYENAIHEQVHE